MKELDLGLIRTDGGTQMRVQILSDVFMDYRDKWNDGVEFEPIDVFYDGTTYWLADGFHRFYGAREAKRKTIKARIHNGSQRDAILFAVGANIAHGLRRTNADKRKAVQALLADEEWRKWSDRKIAEQAAVSNPFVSDIRNQLLTVNSSHNGESRRTGKDGKSRSSKRKKTNGKSEKEKPVSSIYTPKHSASVEDDTHKCPNCGCTWWLPVKFGHNCDRCNHPLGEPIGNPDEDEVETEVGDIEQKEISKAAEGDLKKARAALGVLVRFCDAMELSDKAKPHLEGLAKLIGK